MQAIRRETAGTEDALVMLRAELTVLTLRQKRYPQGCYYQTGEALYPQIR